MEHEMRSRWNFFLFVTHGFLVVTWISSATVAQQVELVVYFNQQRLFSWFVCQWKLPLLLWTPLSSVPMCQRCVCPKYCLLSNVVGWWATLWLPHPFQADSRALTADCQVFLGGWLRAKRGEAWTHTLFLTVGLLITGLTWWFKATILSAAQALTRTDEGKHHTHEEIMI